MIHCHRFTLNGSFCELIYARTGNILAILVLGSYLGIKKESIAHFSVFLANYYEVLCRGSKINILLFLEIGSLPFTPKDFIRPARSFSLATADRGG